MTGRIASGLHAVCVICGLEQPIESAHPIGMDRDGLHPVKYPSYGCNDRDACTGRVLAASALASREPVSVELAAIRAALAETLEREYVVRQMAAPAEPEGGRIAAIRAVLDEADHGDEPLADVLARIDQLANVTRVESGTEPGGGAYLTPSDLALVLGALADAAGSRRDSADGWCQDCTASPGLCDDHANDVDQADAYGTLAAKLGGAR